MSSRRPRHLTGEDAELWRKVAETVKPLSGRKRPPREETAAAPKEPAAEVKPARPAAATAAPARPAAPAPPKSSTGPIDRTLARSLARGARAADAEVDLHGLTQVAAHARLLAFLKAAQANGHRLVLVVTGKGRSDQAGDWWEEGARGVLRRAVPEWLATPPFRALVAGFERAHARKGGDGALYVQLRRAGRRGRAGAEDRR